MTFPVLLEFQIVPPPMSLHLHDHQFNSDQPPPVSPHLLSFDIINFYFIHVAPLKYLIRSQSFKENGLIDGVQI